MLRRNRLSIFIFCILFTCIQNIYAQDFTKDDQEILELKDKRTLGKDNKLLKYLKSDNKQARILTLIALANIADSNTVDDIGKILLTDPENEVRMAASFALGEIPCRRSPGYLLKSLETEKDISAIGEILSDIGKTGDENDLRLINQYETADDFTKGMIAISIARFGTRKIRSQEAIDKLINLEMSIKNEPYKFYYAYSFNRAGDKTLLINAKKEIEALCSMSYNKTRIFAYSALGKLQDDSYMSFILRNFDSEKDWRVEVNMLVAAGNLKINENNFNDSLLEILTNAVTDNPNDNVSITACQTIAKLFSGAEKSNQYLQTIQERLEWILIPNKAVDWQIKAEAIKTLAKIFKDDYRISLFQLYSDAGENYDLKAEIIRSFASMDNALVYKEIRDTISADVQRYNKLHPNKDGSMIGSEDLAKLYRAFVECLSDLGPKLEGEDRNTLRLIFSEFMSSRNTAIVDVCLTSLQDSLYLQYREETGKIMMFDYPELKLPQDADVMQLYIQTLGALKVNDAVETLKKNLSSENYDIAKASADALKNITGKDYESQIKAPKYRTDFDWDFIHRFPDFKTATVHTSVGDVKIELLYKDAPFTAMNFVKLAMKHFYDNTIFHRVVPNFVIQGGDPTGTGYGGPGYSIRSEFTPYNFETGMVGMASSGKDTEGSQFFITHSPQYHLDGKYTIFGKVVSGMDVVDKIQVGDKIESITFSAE